MSNTTCQFPGPGSTLPGITEVGGGKHVTERAFLSLAAERGMSAITTRDIAAAGVNEVTVFRHFGAKAALACEAARRFSPAAGLDACQPRIDAASPQAALDGLQRCLAELRARLAGRPELLQFGLGDAARYPELTGDLKEIPAARPPPADQGLRAGPGPAPRRRQHRRRGHRLPRHAPHARGLAVPALDRPQRRTGHRPARRPAAPTAPPPRRPVPGQSCR